MTKLEKELFDIVFKLMYEDMVLTREEFETLNNVQVFLRIMANWTNECNWMEYSLKHHPKYYLDVIKRELECEKDVSK